MYNMNAFHQLSSAVQIQLPQYPLLPPPPVYRLSTGKDYRPVQCIDVLSSGSETDSSDDGDEDRYTLFCGNLDERVTEELLYEIFLQAGPIESCRIPKDNQGKQRSFGFITYVYQRTIPYALQLYDGLKLFRKLVVIQPQSKSGPSSQSQRQGQYDNQALHGMNYNFQGFNMYSDVLLGNPFRSNMQPDWFVSNTRKMVDERIAKHPSSHSRYRHDQTPYERPDSKRRGNEYQRRHHGGNNRRSEQRNHSRR